MDRCPHSPPQLLASEIKQTFLSTNLACSLASKQQAARTLPFGNTTMTLDNRLPSKRMINIPAGSQSLGRNFHRQRSWNTEREGLQEVAFGSRMGKEG